MATDIKQGDDNSIGWNITFSLPEQVVDSLDDGFNKYGVREYEDGSIDVIFAAMEPGVRRGVEVTDSFLSNVARHDYNSKLPLQYDHSYSQRANVGWIEPQNIKFSNNFLRVMAHIPNTGSQIRSDTINDFTHDPPAISDGSVGFDPRTIEVDSQRGEDPTFVDARLQEFSLTPFPAGYDSGGLSPVFNIGDGPVEMEWGEGDVVQYIAVPDLIGAVSHIDWGRQVAMVSLHNEDGNSLIPTGQTVTAGFDDVIPYDGSSEPIDPEELSDSEYSYSQLLTKSSQLSTI